MLFDHRYMPSSSSMDVPMKNSSYHHPTHLIASNMGEDHHLCTYPGFGQTPDSLHFLLSTPFNQLGNPSMTLINHQTPSFDGLSFHKPQENQVSVKGVSSPTHLNDNSIKTTTTTLPQRRQSNPSAPSSQQKQFSSASTSKRSLEAFASSTDFNDIVVQQSTNQQQTNDNQASYNGKDRYKTELCRSWEETGFCRYGDKCQFAHGRQELRVVTRHHKYKSELCNNYHYEGTCMYGIRCCFIHSIDKAVIGRALSQNIDMVPIQQTSRLPVFKEQIDHSVPLYFFTADSVNQ
nr:unnamed protein product [Naegleria fowleri]